MYPLNKSVIEDSKARLKVFCYLLADLAKLDHKWHVTLDTNVFQYIGFPPIKARHYGFVYLFQRWAFYCLKQQQEQQPKLSILAAIPIGAHTSHSAHSNKSFQNC